MQPGDPRLRQRVAGRALAGVTIPALAPGLQLGARDTGKVLQTRAWTKNGRLSATILAGARSTVLMRATGPASLQTAAATRRLTGRALSGKQCTASTALDTTRKNSRTRQSVESNASRLMESMGLERMRLRGRKDNPNAKLETGLMRRYTAAMARIGRIVLKLAFGTMLQGNFVERTATRLQADGLGSLRMVTGPLRTRTG